MLQSSTGGCSVSRILFSSFLIFPFPFGLSQIGKNPSASEFLRRVEDHYHSARTLQATFLERYSEGRKDVRLESGTVFFSRPGRMRWDYEEPEKKLFLADGLHVWFYVPADRTVSRAKTKESTDWRTPLAMLAGKGSFSRACRVIEWVAQPQFSASAPPPNSSARLGVRCLPKAADAEFSEVALEADSAYRILRILIREPGGIETEFRFAAWQENISLAESLFHFDAPPGVAIVEESLSASPRRPGNE